MTRQGLGHDLVMTKPGCFHNSVLKNSTHINGGLMDQDHTYADTGERGPSVCSPEKTFWKSSSPFQSNIALALLVTSMNKKNISAVFNSFQGENTGGTFLKLWLQRLNNNLCKRLSLQFENFLCYK